MSYPEGAQAASPTCEPYRPSKFHQALDVIHQALYLLGNVHGLVLSAKALKK